MDRKKVIPMMFIALMISFLLIGFSTNSYAVEVNNLQVLGAVSPGTIVYRNDYKSGFSGMGSIYLEKSGVSIILEENIGTTDSRCISINNTDYNAIGLPFTIYGLEPYQVYTAEVFVKGEKVSAKKDSIGASIGTLSASHSGSGTTGTFNWKKLYFSTVADRNGTATIYLRLGWWDNQVKGKVYFDDLILRKYEGAQYGTSQVKLNIDKNDLYNNSTNKLIVSSTTLSNWGNGLNAVYNAYQNFTGYTPYNEVPINILFTNYLSNEVYASDKIEVNKSKIKSILTNLASYPNDWNYDILFGMSQSFDKNAWNFDSTFFGNLKMVYALETTNGGVKLNGFKQGTNVQSYFKSYSSYLTNNRYSSEGLVGIFCNIKDKYGWEPIKRTVQYFNSYESTYASYPNYRKFELFIEKLSEYTNANIKSDFFTAKSWACAVNHLAGYTIINPVVPAINASNISGKLDCSNGHTLNIPVTTTNINNGSILKVSIKKDTQDVTNRFNISNNTIYGSATNISIYISNSIESGKYTVELDYEWATTKKITFEIAIPVTSITLNKTTLNLYVGNKEKLSATVNPSNATNKTLTWSSSNSNVATVDSYGYVTAKAVGNATITVKSGNISTSCNVVVTEKTVPKYPSITIGNINNKINNTGGYSLSVPITTKDIDNNQSLNVVIKKDNQVVTSNFTIKDNVVNNNRVNMIIYIPESMSSGIYTLELSYPNATTKTVNFEIYIPVSTITLDKSDITIYKGESTKLTATINPSNSTNKAITWSSSNTNIATVQQDGTVYANAKGTTTIYAKTSDNKSVSCKIIVEEQANPPVPPIPSYNEIKSEVYAIQEIDGVKIIYKILPGTTFKEFKQNVQCDSTMKFYDNRNHELSDEELLGTGCKIVLEDGTTYFISVTGDLSGDGQLTVTDLALLKLHIIELKTLESVYEQAADVNYTNGITISDLAVVKQVIIGLTSLK